MVDLMENVMDDWWAVPLVDGLVVVKVDLRVAW